MFTTIRPFGFRHPLIRLRNWWKDCYQVQPKRLAVLEVRNGIRFEIQ